MTSCARELLGLLGGWGLRRPPLTVADYDNELLMLESSEDAILLWPANVIVERDYGATMFGVDLNKGPPPKITNWTERPVNSAERREIAKIDIHIAKHLSNIPVLDWPIRIDRNGQEHIDVFDELAADLGNSLRGATMKNLYDLKRAAIKRVVDARYKLGQSADNLKGYLHWSM